MLEERAAGQGALWAWRQALSTVRVRRRIVTGRPPRERWTEMLSNLWSDIRYAMRTFRRNPGFTAAAIVPIALGIGINTGIFSILDGLALRPLPAPEANELVTIYQQFKASHTAAPTARTSCSRCRSTKLSRHHADAFRSDGVLGDLDGHARRRVAAGDRRRPRHLQLL